jgi:hypothetical protein
LTAISISASSQTMNGALPPSSSDGFFTVPAHRCISNLPTSVEPVKVSCQGLVCLVPEGALYPNRPRFESRYSGPGSRKK